MLAECNCGRYFNQRFPGILPWKRSTEVFRRQVFWSHFDGICRKKLSERQRIGTATIERWFHDFLKLQASKMSSEPCPQELGIDEHFFTRREGYATTFCDLKNHKVYDVVLGRSEASLDGYFRRLKGKEHVRVVCIDLASNYRSLIRKHFPNARIVADRFHVIRIVNHHFLATWRTLDPVGSKNRGLLSLMRRHEENLAPEQKERLRMYFSEHPEVGPILGSWDQEIAAMWRFTKNNGITEGFHNKMEMISRRAFGFRNFENYRLRVRVMCS